MTLTADQQAIRRTKLTASQVSAVLGVSPYFTARILAESKQKSVARRSSHAMNSGHYLEPIVAKWCADRSMLNLNWDHCYLAEDLLDRLIALGEVHEGYRVGGTIICPQEPLFAATPDYVVFNGHDNEVINYEIKTSAKTDGWMDPSSYHGVPHHIWIQVQWQMMCLRAIGLDVKRTAIGALLASRPYFRWVPYDHGFICGIVERCRVFQHNCNNGMLPADVKARPRLTGEDVPLGYELLLRRYAALKKRADEAKELAEEAKAAVAAMAYKHGPATSIDGHQVVVYKQKVSRTTPTRKIADDLAEKLRELGHEDAVKATYDKHCFDRVRPESISIRVKKES